MTFQYTYFAFANLGYFYRFINWSNHYNESMGGTSTPPRRGSTPKKKSTSPSFKKKTPPLMSPTKPPSYKSSTPTITIWAMPDCVGPLEIMLYCTSPDNDGYMGAVMQWSEGTITCPYLREARFMRCVSRRQPDTSNLIMKNRKKNFWRKLIVAIPLGDGSTEDGRLERALVYKRFLMDDRFTRYPPAEIAIVDATDDGNRQSMDRFMTDTDIEETARSILPEEILNDSFYETYPDVARAMYSGQHYGRFALSLGFPPTPYTSRETINLT